MKSKLISALLVAISFQSLFPGNTPPSSKKSRKSNSAANDQNDQEVECVNLSTIMLVKNLSKEFNLSHNEQASLRVIADSSPPQIAKPLATFLADNASAEFVAKHLARRPPELSFLETLNPGSLKYITILKLGYHDLDSDGKWVRLKVFLQKLPNLNHLKISELELLYNYGHISRLPGMLKEFSIKFLELEVEGNDLTTDEMLIFLFKNLSTSTTLIFSAPKLLCNSLRARLAALASRGKLQISL